MGLGYLQVEDASRDEARRSYCLVGRDAGSDGNDDRGTPLSSAEFVGLENYGRLLPGADENFWPAVWVTLGFLVGATVTTVVPGTVLALLLDRITVGRGLATNLLMVPLVMAPVMAGLLWRLMFNDLNGVLNAFLRPIGLDQPWLGSPVLALMADLLARDLPHDPGLLHR